MYNKEEFEIQIQAPFLFFIKIVVCCLVYTWCNVVKDCKLAECNFGLPMFFVNFAQ